MMVLMSVKERRTRNTSTPNGSSKVHPSLGIPCVTRLGPWPPPHAGQGRAVACGAGQKQGNKRMGVGPNKKWAQRVHKVGRCGVGEKNNSFLVETLSKLRFFGTLESFHPIHFQKHMTGRSNVRDKVCPIWVRKTFNYFHSYNIN
jgi:hypothetical protein